MSAALITLPCTARQLEAALHSYCDHHGAWDMRIMSDAISSGRSIQDTRITLALSEGSGETSPSPSSPTSSAPTDSAAMRKALEAARDLLLPQCNGGTAFAKACSSTVNKIVDALAKPPRNCDRFETEDEMKSAFIAYYNKTFGLKGTDKIYYCDLKHNVDNILYDYIKWLLTPMKQEMKGETDGK